MVSKYSIQGIKCVYFEDILEHFEYILPQVKNNVFGIVNELEENMGWNGKYTLKDTMHGMQYGFEKETDYFLNLISDVRVQDDLGNGTYMDCEGFAYDMGSVVEGIPECCLNYKIPTVVPCVKILVDISFNCMTSPTMLNNRGIAIANLVNTLLINGFIVDLHYMMYNHQSDMDVMFTLKVDTHTLPISTIAFISSVDYFRKIGFITMDVIRNKESELSRGNSTIKQFMLDKIKKDKIFFIAGGYSDSELCKHLHTPEEATKYLLESFSLYCKKNKIKISFNVKGETNDSSKNS